jgi:hypothetical protein
MKHKFYFLIFIGTILLSIPAIAQKTVVVVEPDEGVEIGAINAAIQSAEDAGTAGNTIFELRRGGLYLLNGDISHTGYTLHIRAEEGDGPRPVLQPAADEQGNSDRHFSCAGLILEGLYLQGRGEMGAIASQPIRVTTENSRIVIDDCFIDYAGQSIVRLNTTGNSVFIKNSIIRNSLLPDDPANGRTIDTRGNPQDTLSIEFSTIYNNGARIIRPDGAEVLHINFNHNTVYQVSFTQDFGLDITKDVKVTNNVFYNFAYRADNTAHNPFFSADSIGEGASYTDADRSFDFRNNNFYQQQELGDILEQFDEGGRYRFNSWDTEQQDTIWFEYVMRTNVFASQAILDTAVLTPKPVLLHFIANGQADTTNIFSEMLTFDNAPPLNIDYWKFFVENNYSIIGSNPPNPFADENPDVLGEVTEGAYSFRYNGDARSATAAEGGVPLGDPRWVPVAPPTFTLTINVSPANAGVVTGAGEYVAGAEVEITATANEGFSFVNFTIGDDIVTLVDGKYTMPENNVTITANFDEQVGISDMPISGRLNVYPNPSYGHFNVEFTTQTNKNVKFEIINITGQMVFSREYQNRTRISDELNLEHLGKGLYFMVIREDSNVNTSRIVIQ